MLFTDQLRASPTRSLSPFDRTKRRFSTMVSSAAAAAVSRRFSATIGWCLATPPDVKPQIVRQGRALCLQYIKTQIRRSPTCPKKVIRIPSKYTSKKLDHRSILLWSGKSQKSGDVDIFALPVNSTYCK